MQDLTAKGFNSLFLPQNCLKRKCFYMEHWSIRINIPVHQECQTLSTFFPSFLLHLLVKPCSIANITLDGKKLEAFH